MGHDAAVAGDIDMTLWTARTLRVLVVLFLLADAASHVLKPAPVVDAFQRLGFPLTLSPELGILMLVLLVLYAVPRTSVAGAILLTGYLGGAVATQLRAGSPPFETMFPVLVGILVWVPLGLTDQRARAIVG
jgi:integral membrane sensor domain MASE1